MGIPKTIQDRLDEARELIEEAERFKLPEHVNSSHRDSFHYSEAINDLVNKARGLIRLIPSMSSASEEDKMEAETLLDLGERVRKHCWEKLLYNGTE